MKQFMASAVFLALSFGGASVSWAAAILESVKGDVKSGVVPTATTAVKKGERILPGVAITTGPNSEAILRFDDGQVVVLNQNSEFKVIEYSFKKEEPKSDKIVFELLRGALRSVSGLIGRRSSAAYALRFPQATIGIRGSPVVDFIIALENPAYLSVLSGTVTVTNAAGTVAFGAGASGMVASATTLATAIPAAALPPTASAAVSSLGAAAVGAPAVAVAAPGIGVGAAAAVGAVAAGIAAAAGGGAGPTIHHATTTHH